MRNPHRFVSNTHSFPKNTRFIGKKPIGTIITDNHCLLTHVLHWNVVSFVKSHQQIDESTFFGCCLTCVVSSFQSSDTIGKIFLWLLATSASPPFEALWGFRSRRWRLFVTTRFYSLCLEWKFRMQCLAWQFSSYYSSTKREKSESRVMVSAF